MAFYGVIPFGVTFTDTSSVPGATTWSWDFGDGVGTSTSQNPTYVYTTAGTFTVTLEVTCAYGIIEVTDTVIAVDLAANLYGCWLFNEATGTRQPAYGTAPAMLETGTVSSATGRNGSYALSSTEADTSELSNTISLAASAGLTIAFWFYWPVYSSAFPKSMFVVDNGAGPVSPYLFVYRFYNSNFLEVTFDWTTSSVSLPTPRLGGYPVNGWHLFVLTYNATTGVLRGRVDQGCLASATDWTALPLPAYRLSATVPAAELANANAAVFTRLSWLKEYNGSFVNYEGRIDEPSIWPVVLSDAKIESLWCEGYGLTPIPGSYLQTQSLCATYADFDPQVLLRVSNDAGKTWITEQQRSAGKLGEYYKRVRWNRLGAARRRVFEVVVTDPIPWRITNCYLTASDGSGQVR